MPRNKVTEVFKYEELSDRAKEKAREWYTRDYPDSDWWDSCYEVFTEVCEIIGVELETKPVRLMGGGTRREPMIFFRGFWSQGDGACFAGDYREAESVAWDDTNWCIDWEEYEREAQRGRISGNLFMHGEKLYMTFCS